MNHTSCTDQLSQMEMLVSKPPRKQREATDINQINITISRSQREQCTNNRTNSVCQVQVCYCMYFSDNGGSHALRDIMSSWGELIELRDLRTDGERIELTGSRSPCSPPRLERTNALRISPGKVPDLLSRVGIIRVLSSTQDPQMTEERGEGHNFQPCSHAQPTWCDLCGDFIWGLYKQSLRCVSESAYIGSLHAWVCACVIASVHRGGRYDKEEIWLSSKKMWVHAWFTLHSIAIILQKSQL